MNWSPRLKNYGLWVSIAALLFMSLEAFGVELVAEQYNSFVDSLLGVLVLLGLVNNPSTANYGFLDDKSSTNKSAE